MKTWVEVDLWWIDEWYEQRESEEYQSDEMSNMLLEMF